MSEEDSRRALWLHYQTRKQYSDERIARASPCCASIMVESNDLHALDVEGNRANTQVIIADADRRVAEVKRIYQRDVEPSEVAKIIGQIRPAFDKSREYEREIEAYRAETKKLAQALERVEKLETELEQMKQEWLASEEKKDSRLSRLYR